MDAARTYKKTKLFVMSVTLYSIASVIIIALIAFLLFAVCKPVGENEYQFGFCAPIMGVFGK